MQRTVAEIQASITEVQKLLLDFTRKFTDAEIIENRRKYDDLILELKAAEDAALTPEQREARQKYEEAHAEYNNALQAYEQAKQALSTIYPDCPLLGKVKPKNKATGENSNSNHTSNKLTYDDCQNIRKLFSEGVKVDEIAKKYNITTGVVMYKVRYQQSKLKKGDKAWTPLINKYYPKFWKDNDGIIRSGAPYAEDNVTEAAQQYKGWPEYKPTQQEMEKYFPLEAE